MDEVTLYRVCPERNVPAAFQCFFGPDSRGLERFFGDTRTHWADDTVLIVRARSRRAFDGVVHKLRAGAASLGQAVDDFNPAIAWCWLGTLYVAGFMSWTLTQSARRLYRAARLSAHLRLAGLLASRTVGGLPV